MYLLGTPLTYTNETYIGTQYNHTYSMYEALSTHTSSCEDGILIVGTDMMDSKCNFTKGGGGGGGGGVMGHMVMVVLHYTSTSTSSLTSWKCWRHVGVMLPTRDIVGKFRRHGLSLPTTCQQDLDIRRTTKAFDLKLLKVEVTTKA